MITTQIVQEKVALIVAALACFLFALGTEPVAAQENGAKPFLHPLFTDDMVFQRDIAAPVWGWTTPGATVTVRMGGKSATAKADAGGKWMAKLGPFPAGGPHTLSVTGPHSVTLHNVLTGDVWICSGQSNMEMGIGAVNNAQAEIAKADFPQVRLYSVPKKIATEPESLVAAHWDVCTPQTVAAGGWGGFSAVGYFFGRQLHQDLHVPIGLIHTSWGGTVAEAWTSLEALNTMDDFKPAIASYKQTVATMKSSPEEYTKLVAEWWKKNDTGMEKGFAQKAFGADGWKTMKLPTLWENAGLPDYDGLVWFRKEIVLPDGWQGKDLMLRLGPIDDNDTTFINGVQVGETAGYNVPRDYKVPAGLLKPGKNVIAVRVLDTGGGGGIYGNAADMRLELPGDANTISLAGNWVYKDTMPLAKMTPFPQRMDNNPNVTTVLYNGMIAPLIPFGIKGAIWYQGESNAGRADQYSRLLPTMIKDWRSRFGVGPFPFYIVQLANFMPVDTEPKDDPWPYLREAQSYTAKTVPNTAVALAIDIGDAGDIHPKNKQEVGRRLALNAEALTYKMPVEYSGPEYRSAKIEDDKIRLSFDHLAGGLVAKGDAKLTGFAIAGDDKKYVWADAKIEGDTVVVSSPKVTNPKYVRYAWSNNPVANLYNRAALPASPFRTDK